MILAALIFLLTLTLVIWQPRGLGIGWSASLGALLALSTGVVSLNDVPVVWQIIWNATAAFIAIIIISLLLDEAGFFRFIALKVTQAGQGQGHRLFAMIILLGALVAALFANDGAALILTPIVVSILAALRFQPAAILAFVMAAGFIADVGSLPLVVSNLVNIVVADYFKLGFARYASVMVPVNLVAVGSALVMLYLVFRRQLPRQYALDTLPAPVSAITDPLTFRLGWLVLAGLLAGFFILEPMGIPISLTATVGALVLLGAAYLGRVIHAGQILRHAPWQIVIFSLGMYLVVYGLRNAGLTDYLAQWLTWLGQQGLMVATLGTGMTTAVLSSIMNNMPTVLISSLAIHDAQQLPPAVREGMIYASVIGCDLGPKITPIGSLATLLWLHVLQQKGIVIGWGQYFRLGIILTVPVLLITLLALVARLSVH